MSSSFLKLRKHDDGPVIVTPSIYGGEQINTLTLLEGNQQKEKGRKCREWLIFRPKELLHGPLRGISDSNCNRCN